MDLHKIAHDIYEASKHWHLTLFAGLIDSIRLHSKVEERDRISGLGEVIGDNILQKEILISLSSRRGL
ncbi:MAG: hypothetical protein NTU54_03545 [Candidatus Omnitrophica bacterium]|nr:hypothetical protein [Candidatus Omnitrophota bacterium]